MRYAIKDTLKTLPSETQACAMDYSSGVRMILNAQPIHFTPFTKDRNLHAKVIPFKAELMFCPGAHARPSDCAEGLFMQIVSRFAVKPDGVVHAAVCNNCR